MLIRHAVEIEYELICAELAAIDPWKHHNLTKEKLLHFLNSDPGRKIIIIEIAKDIIGCIMYRFDNVFKTLCDKKAFPVLQKFYSDKCIEKPEDLEKQLPLSCYMHIVGIFGSNQGKGYGKQLLDYITAFAIKANIFNLYLMVSHINPRAKKFYEREGFMEIGVIHGLHGEDNIDFLMFKNTIS